VAWIHDSFSHVGADRNALMHSVYGRVLLRWALRGKLQLARETCAKYEIKEMELLCDWTECSMVENVANAREERCGAISER
jgi:hypothetical protein